MFFPFSRSILWPMRCIQRDIRLFSTRKRDSQIAGPWRVSVVCAGEDATASTVLLETPAAGYLFNCGETAQRCLMSNHVRESFNKISNIFLTSTSYTNMAGLLGYSLSTRHRSSKEAFAIYGHKHNSNLFGLLQLYTEIRLLDVLNAAWHEASHHKFEDGAMRVESVKLRPTLGAGQCSTEEIEDRYAVAYIVGHASSPEDSGARFLVLECPSEEYLDSLLSSEQLKTLTTNPDTTPTLVVHMSPAHVTEHEQYKEFMSRFGQKTRHLMVNKNSPVSYVRAAHQWQQVLHRIQPATFPAIQSHGQFPAPPTVPRGKIVQGFNGLQFVLGANPHFELPDSLYQNAQYDNRKTSARHVPDSGKTDEDDYPEVVFLGTSSGTSTWFRNPSGILLQTRKDRYVLLDCGEGSLQQLYQLYGGQQAERVLANLEVVILSHLHYDHIGGLPSLIEAHSKACRNLGKPSKLRIIAPKIFLRWVAYFERYFGELSSKISVLSHEDLQRGEYGRSYEQIQSMNHDLALTQITPVSVEHTETAYGTVLQHVDGWKLVYSGDCRPTKALVKAGKDCDILIHEATYPDDQQHMAVKRKHCTIGEAIDVAQQMDAKFTILTHLKGDKPTRMLEHYYRDSQYSRITFAYDFMKELESQGLIPKMWPIIVAFARTYAPYLTFPIAVAVGFVGYNAEQYFPRKETPWKDKTALEERDERKLNELEQKDPTDVPSLKSMGGVRKGILRGREADLKK